MKYKTLKYFASIKKILAIAAIREIRIHEIENGSQFVKYTTLENNHLYGTLKMAILYLRIGEAIQLVTLKLHWATYVWWGYPYTKFRPNLRASCRKIC